MRLSSVLRFPYDFGGRDVAHWFPGHMAKGMKQMRAKLTRVDCIVEVHDARLAPIIRAVESHLERLTEHLTEEKWEVRNSDKEKKHLEEKLKEKRIITQLRKQEVGKVIYTDCIREENVRKIVPAITERIESHPRFNRAENPEICIMVTGIPNVGKSSLINALRRIHLRKGKASRVGGEPGITRSVLCKIQISENPLIYLLDTPGVLSPRIENVETGMKLALCGTILDHLVGEEMIADYLLYTLNNFAQHSYVQHYELEGPCDDIETLLKKIAKKLGKTQVVKAITGTGNVNITIPNYSAAAYDFIRAFRKGDLGRVTLD